MPKQKLKTHKGTAKRIKLSATGKALRLRANGTHFLEKKSSSRKRVIATKAPLKGAVAKKLKQAIGA